MTAEQDRPIDFTKFEELWNSAALGSTCQFPHEVSQDENGVFWIICKGCGLYGCTSIDGARKLGWIE